MNEAILATSSSLETVKGVVVSMVPGARVVGGQVPSQAPAVTVGVGPGVVRPKSRHEEGESRPPWKGESPQERFPP